MGNCFTINTDRCRCRELHKRMWEISSSKKCISHDHICICRKHQYTFAPIHIKFYYNPKYCKAIDHKLCKFLFQGFLHDAKLLLAEINFMIVLIL